MVEKLVLEARELRQARTRRMVDAHQAVISVTANRPGWPKENLLANYVIYHFLCRLLERYPTAVLETAYDNLGAFCLLGLHTEPYLLKNETMRLEAKTLGRLVDLDVTYLKNGKMQSVTRETQNKPPRSCYICDDDARVCRRLARHDSAALQEAFDAIFVDYLSSLAVAEKLSVLAQAALWSELCRSNGFGSVTLNSPGSHKDMDSRLMLTSIASLGCSLSDVTQQEWQSFSSLRQAGLRIESRLLEATKGVNTHKGALFHFLIVTSALFHVPQITDGKTNLKCFADTLTEAVKERAAPLMDDLIAADAVAESEWPRLAIGLQSYLKYGHAGARQEAIYGYASLLRRWLPRYTVTPELHPLLPDILHATWDTTSLKRGGYGLLQTLRHMALRASEADDIRQLSIWCEAHGLSTGGSADLIALLYYVYLIYRFRTTLGLLTT